MLSEIKNGGVRSRLKPRCAPHGIRASLRVSLPCFLHRVFPVPQKRHDNFAHFYKKKGRHINNYSDVSQVYESLVLCLVPHIEIIKLHACVPDLGVATPRSGTHA